MRYEYIRARIWIALFRWLSHILKKGETETLRLVLGMYIEGEKEEKKNWKRDSCRWQRALWS